MTTAENEPGQHVEVPRLLGAVRDALTPARGAPLAAGLSELAEAIRYSTAICLEIKKPAKSQAGEDSEADDDPSEITNEAAGTGSNPKKGAKIEALIDKGEIPAAILQRLSDPALTDARIVAARDNLLIAVSMLGTHGGKVPDARSTVRALMPIAGIVDATAGESGVHSGSVATTHPMSASGNATQNPHQRFLCMALKFGDSAPVALCSVLAGDSPEKEAILKACGKEAASVLAEIGAAVEKRMTRGEGVPSRVPGSSPQVLFPVGEDGRYVAVTPIYPYAIGAELHVRHQARAWCEDEMRRQLLDTRVVHVGGTKPQNTGMLATYLAGRFPRLVAMPQHPGVNADRLVRQFKMHGVALNSGGIPTELVLSFFNALAARDHKPNKETRASVIDSVGAMCDAVLSDVAQLAREHGYALAVGGRSLVEDPKYLPEKSVEVARLLGIIPNETTTETDLDAGAARVADKVTERLHGRKRPGSQAPFVVNGDMIALITGVARQRLEEFM
jgi:hypothetical protein